MATNRDLLKEAIADAKAVKEMAIANAKTALEEAFTPRLKEMLSAKIQEMDEEVEEVEESVEEGMYEEDDKDAVKEETVEEEGFGKNSAKGDEGFSDMEEKALDEVDLEELLAELEEEEKEEVEETLNEAEEEEEVEDEVEVEDEEESEEEEGEPLDLEDMTDEDLKKMIEDVIADMIESGELEAGEGEAEESEEEGEEVEVSDEEEVDLTELLKEIEDEMTEEKVTEEEEKATPEEEKIDKELQLEQMLNEEPFTAATLAIMLGGMGTLIGAGVSMAAIMNRLEKKAKAGSEKAQNLLKKLHGMGSGAASATRSGMSKGKMDEELAELQAENKSLKSELNEAVKETNSTNLLNAKLLYTNKIFRSKNLNESQKVKVLSSFDKANTVKEAKLVYETLGESLKAKKNTIKENIGRASKATTVPTTKKPIVESNEVFARMQKLAGIK